MAQTLDEQVTVVERALGECMIDTALVVVRAWLNEIGENNPYEEAFTSILNTYRKAERHRLTRFTLLRIIPESESELIIDVGNRAAAHLRQDDHLGMGADGNLYILLPNTALKNAEIVMNRLKDYSIHTVAADNVNKGEEQ